MLSSTSDRFGRGHYRPGNVDGEPTYVADIWRAVSRSAPVGQTDFRFYVTASSKPSGSVERLGRVRNLG